MLKFEYMCHSGSDLLVCNAARVSFAKQTEWKFFWEFDQEDPRAKGKPVSLSDKDMRLIVYLAREKHLLPFRHPTATFRCSAPVFLARQLGKHQAGMSWSEESRRYIKSEPVLYWPDTWRKAAANVKQGSTDEPIDVSSICKHGNDVHSLLYECVDMYNTMIDRGVAPEQARMILPQNMMINWVWTGTLLAWFHLWEQRSEAHAQKEARDFAGLVDEELFKLYPASWESLKAQGSK